MSYMARSEINRLTWTSIQTSEALASYTDQRGYPCGCRPHHTRPHLSFWLCEFHDGFDDGVSAARDYHKEYQRNWKAVGNG